MDYLFRQNKGQNIEKDYKQAVHLFHVLRRIFILRYFNLSQFAVTLLIAVFLLSLRFYFINSATSSSITISAQLLKLNYLDNSMVGSVNYDEWLCGPFVGYLVDDLRIHHHQWPKHPTNRRTSLSVHVYHERIQHMGAKVYGYILPPITGTYQFRILQRACKAAVSGELWISTDSNPMNLIKLTELTYSMKDVGFLSFSNVSKAVSVGLQDNQKYYFEFHVKGHKGRIDTLVEWKLPKYDEFQSIPSSFLSLAVKIHEKNPFLSNKLPSNRLQSIGYTKHISYNVTKITDLNILPECELPQPILVRPIKYNPFIIDSTNIAPESSMYPPDTNRYFDAKKLGSSAHFVNNKEVSLTTFKVIHKLYKKTFNKQDKYKGKVLGVHYLEETYNEGYGGSRFLLEMDVQLQNGIVHTSEYVYLPKDGKKLCHTTNFQWKRNVHVTLIVAMKNVGQWVDHLIYSLEDIYQETKDENFELVVLDFHSTDKDIEGTLKKSSLPKWKYIPFKGKFHKTLALQTGIDYVKDDNSIIMTLDMHLNLPPNFIESARKHTIQGKMAYAPMVLRLDEGYTKNHPNGFWEIHGFGLFSMYKSDWIAVGGWDTVTFTYKRGGEDIELYDRVTMYGYDVFRCRPPGLFHYYHSKVGLWNNNVHSGDKFGC